MRGLSQFLPGLLIVLLVGCGGGGSGGSDPVTPPPPAPPPIPEPPPAPSPVITANESSRFLSQATFGPTTDEIDDVSLSGAEEWFLDQLELPASTHLEYVLASFPDGQYRDENGDVIPQAYLAPTNSFWRNSIEAPDQLRQRMAFALSQILVVSLNSNVGLWPHMMAGYMDTLTDGAFGNYRDLIEDVTYSPAMSVYLTYFRNQKADPETGRVPDENYARELLQLFTVGLVELNADGSTVLDGEGNPVELFDNEDITGLAKVFTGLSADAPFFYSNVFNLPDEAYYSPLRMFDFQHSTDEKSFLGTTIPAGTGGDESTDLALDAIFAHPNVGPFLGRQLIQRFVTSSPEPAYIERVATAFDDGEFTLPTGETVGTGERGDLAATLAAVLFDDNARSLTRTEDADFGKLREPVIRFTHWARAFEINEANAPNEPLLWNTGSAELLGQAPFQSPSVFNFYRPGFIAPGTETGDAGLTAPELQIANATTVVGYPNVLTLYALEFSPKVDDAVESFVPNYFEAAALASDTEAMLDYYDVLLTHGTLEDETRQRIGEAMETIPLTVPDAENIRARLASIMVMTAPEYVVLR